MLILRCVLVLIILPHTHTTIYVSSYSYYYMCPHTHTIHESSYSYYYICVLIIILLYMCPRTLTALYVSSYSDYYIFVLIGEWPRLCACTPHQLQARPHYIYLSIYLFFYLSIYLYLYLYLYIFTHTHNHIHTLCSRAAPEQLQA